MSTAEVPCFHPSQFSHPYSQDIRLCEDCSCRSVDGGVTWMSFNEYRALHCGPAKEERRKLSTLRCAVQIVKVTENQGFFKLRLMVPVGEKELIFDQMDQSHSEEDLKQIADNWRR